MTVFEVKKYMHSIVEREAVRETEHCVFFAGENGRKETRESKNSEYSCFFHTRDEAFRFAEDRLHRQLINARDNVIRLEMQLAELA